MIATARTAKIGVELDKAMEKQYQSANTYQIENLTDLNYVAQKIKQADKLLADVKGMKFITPHN